MRFVCESCQAQYFIRDEKVGPNGAVVRCKRCNQRITLRRSADDLGGEVEAALSRATALDPDRASTRVMSLADLAGLTLGEPPSEEKPRDPEPACGFSAADVEWFVAIGERQVGPLSIAAVSKLRERGEISGDSLCWRAGMSDWSRIAQVPRLAGKIGLAAPVAKEPAGAVAVGVQAVVLPPPPLPGVVAELARKELEALEVRVAEKPQAIAEPKPVPAAPVPEILPPIAPPEPEAPIQLASKPRAARPAPNTDLQLAIGIPALALAIAILMIGIAILARMPKVVTPAIAPAAPPAPIVIATPAPRHEEVPAQIIVPPPAQPAPVLEPPHEKAKEKVEAPRKVIAPPPPSRRTRAATRAAPAPRVAQTEEKKDEIAEIFGEKKTKVDTSEIMEVLIAHRGEIKKCTDAVASPETQNTIVMRWSIRPDGSVANVLTVTESFRGSALSECLAATLSKLRFPEYSGPPMEPTEVPLRF